MLALTFADKADYDKIREHDLISVIGLMDFAPGRTSEDYSSSRRWDVKKVLKYNIRIMNSR